MSKRDGGFAFPQGAFDGMTMRRWYKGMIAAQVAQTYAECDPKYAARVAAVCGELADALIAEDKEAEK